MRALVLAALALAACTNNASNLAPCSVTSLAGADVSESYIDCGSFSVGDPNYTSDAMAAAQACVLNALSQNTSFLLVYDAADESGNVTGDVAAGWVGTLEPGPHILAREYAGQGHSGDMSMTSVSATTCATVGATSSCTPAIGIPCLTCTELSVPSVVCRD